MTPTIAEPPAAAAARMLRGEFAPATLMGLIFGIMALAATLLVLSVDRIQTTLLERDAVAKGLHWTNGLLGALETVEAVFVGGALSERDRDVIALASRLGGLKAFLIFDRDGRVIAASDPDELGRINVSSYWASEVLRGSPHVAIETTPAGGDGQAGTVAETYLPVVARSDGRSVVGAFEAYLDVSDSARAYGRIGFYASMAGTILLAAAGIAAVAFVRRTMVFRMERERMLAAETQAAAAANAAKSRFLATVSHEIRTPMNGVLGTIELLDASPLDADQREMTAVIRRSAGGLLELLNQLLDQSKIEAGKLDIADEPFDPGQVIREALEVVRPAARAKRLDLSAEVPADFPRAVLGDSARVRQILLNLLSNAVKFTERGEVAIIAGRADGAARGMTIRVRDSGIGIEPGALARLFRPFEQADASTTRRFGGTGLGLTIARELAELMGGSLEAASTPGRGSEFTLTLPFRPCDGVPSPVAAAAVRAELGLDVLVADDDPTNRWVIGRQLGRLGCRPMIVEDGRAALDAWSSEPGRWQVVVTDWHMPVLDGLGLLEALHADPRFHSVRPMVVMLSASGLPEEIARARAAGADLVLVKPVTLERLSAALAEVVVAGAATVPGPTPVDGGVVLDTGELEMLCDGDRTMLADVLGQFADRLAQGRHDIATAGDAARRRAAAHALGGAASAVGAQALAGACGRLEAAGDETAAASIEAVGIEADRVTAALRERMVVAGDGA